MLFTVPHAREQAVLGSDADSSAFRFMEGRETRTLMLGFIWRISV